MLDTLPLELCCNILQYTNPYSLRIIVDNNINEIIPFINNIYKKKYVEKWLDSNKYNNRYKYKVKETDELKDIIEKYWFMWIKFNNNTYKKLDNTFTKLPNIKYLCIDISRTTISDVSMLGGLHTLNIIHCYNIRDVSMLGGLHTLDARWTNISDVSMLGRLHKLDIRGCKNISDISMLGGLHTLDISGCQNISDVSMLNNVKNLYT